MDNRLLLINLYDIYKNLLTDKQQAYFEDYYYNNLTLQEISDFYSISRNAIHKVVKETEEKLVSYEEKLLLHQRFSQVKLLTKDLVISKQIEEII